MDELITQLHELDTEKKSNLQPTLIKKKKTGANFVNRSTEFNCVYMFLFHLIEEIEIKNYRENKLIKIQFPKKPECFLLSEVIKEGYRENCSIKDSNKKMSDLMRMFDVLKVSMDQNLENFRNRKIIYFIINRDMFGAYMVIIWIFGFINNILLAFDLQTTYKPGTAGEYVVEEEEGTLKKIRYFLNLIIGCGSVFFLVLWFAFQHHQNMIEKRERYKLDNPFLDHYSYKSLFIIYILNPILYEKVILSFGLHIMVSVIVLATPRHHFFNGFHLMTIHSINKAARDVLNSISTHYNQLVVVFLLMTIFVFTFSTIIMEYLNEEWESSYEHINCDTLYNCF